METGRVSAELKSSKFPTSPSRTKSRRPQATGGTKEEVGAAARREMGGDWSKREQRECLRFGREGSGHGDGDGDGELEGERVRLWKKIERNSE